MFKFSRVTKELFLVVEYASFAIRLCRMRNGLHILLCSALLVRLCRVVCDLQNAVIAHVSAQPPHS
jgi:hypothetical protein